jgi:hypothetical protein
LQFHYYLVNQETTLIRSDHFSRWYATNKLVTEGRSIYDSRNGQEIVSLNTIPVDPIEGSFFYPAHLLIFILPIANLPYPVAHFIWLTLIQIFSLLAIWIIYREIHWPSSVNKLTVLVMLSIVFIPSFQNTIWGQFNSISVLSLALVYISLRRNRYFIAGLCAIGLTFKPQTMLISLIFLLIWASVKRKRWPFNLGFGLIGLSLWLFAERLEPNWIISFIKGVQTYSAYLHPQPVTNELWLPSWLLIGLIILLDVWIFIRNVQSTPTSIPFVGCIILSLATWWIIAPIYGMMYLVAIPIVIMLLFSSLDNFNVKLYKFGLLSFVLLYFMGVVGFLYGLSTPSLYGQHIKFTELVYKILLPILIIVLSLPLALPKKSSFFDR